MDTCPNCGAVNTLQLGFGDSPLIGASVGPITNTSICSNCGKKWHPLDLAEAQARLVQPQAAPSTPSLSGV